MRKLFMILLVVFFTTNVSAQSINLDSITYKQFDNIANRLYQQSRYQDAISILTVAKDQYPDHYAQISFYLTLNNFLVGNSDAALAEMQNGIDKGLWYGFHEDWDLFDSVRQNEAFVKLIKIDQERKAKVEKLAKPELFVQLPDNFKADSSYPLFIALHGWGMNNEEFMEKWNSSSLKKDYIVAFMQSSQVADMDGFAWNDSEKGAKEIGEMYAKVKAKYPINEARVYVGGFSQGGKMAIYLTLEAELPVKAFIALAPAVPENMTDEKILAAKKAKKKGVLIVGGMDAMFDKQMEMKLQFAKNRFIYKFKPKNGIGHEFPKHFDEILNGELKFVK
jgi:predicted esterase